MTAKAGEMPLALKVAKLISVIGILWHIYVLLIEPTSPGVMRPVHVLFLVILAALVFPKPGGERLKRIFFLVDWMLIGLVFASTVHILSDQAGWAFRAGIAPTTLDVIFATATTVLVLELTRRLFGYPLVVISLVFIAYAAFGFYAPGIFKILPHDYSRIMGHIYSVENGIFGLMTGISATIILPFMLLGRIMLNTGTGGFFIDLANSLTGKSRGGPAKVAVVSSALFGTISGSGAANVVATGAFTIPLMKSAGYTPRFAAAVEAVASTGGQITPPIMASAAFLAAELTGIPYGTLATAAIIPAFLYYLALYVTIDLEAGRLKLPFLAPDNIPQLGLLLKQKGYLLLPLLSIIYMLMVQNASPLRAAMVAIGVAIVMSWVNPETRMGIIKLFDAMFDAAKDLVPIGMAFVSAGIVVSMINLTGLGIKLTSLIMNLAQEQVLLALLITMVITIILGMGLPVAASYVLAAAICAPALIKMGIPTLPAHLFIIHFASLSAITPPVALSAYAAAGIAKENPFLVALTACRIGIVALVVPFMFVTGPALLLMEGIPLALRTGISAAIGAVAITFAVQGWWRKAIYWPLRVLFFVGGILMIEVRVITDALGIFLIGSGLVVHLIANPDLFRSRITRGQA